jgi:hypothetical protein
LIPLLGSKVGGLRGVLLAELLLVRQWLEQQEKQLEALRLCEVPYFVRLLN